MSRPYAASHGFTPGRFGAHCRVMLARFPCPFGRSEHDPAKPPEDVDAFGRRRRADAEVWHAAPDDHDYPAGPETTA